MVKVRFFLLTVVASGIGTVGGSRTLGGRGYIQGSGGGWGGFVCVINFSGCPLAEVEAFLMHGRVGRVDFEVLGCGGAVIGRGGSGEG